MSIKIETPNGMRRASNLSIEDLVAIMQVMPDNIGVDELVEITFNIVMNNDLSEKLAEFCAKLIMTANQVGYRNDAYEMDDLVAQMKKGAN